MAENQVKPLNMRESMDLMDQIVDAVRMVGGNDADLRLLSRSSSARRRVARIIKGEETDQIYRTKIRYGMSYQERVKSCVDLQEHKRSVDTPWEMTTSGPPELELRLVRYEYLIEHKPKLGGIEHLLDFAFYHPDELGEDYRIVAPAAVWKSQDDKECATYLMRDGDGKRTLRHYWSIEVDISRYRFLIINS